jgi:hypothetical protein
MQGASREELTTIFELLRNLNQLMRIKDERVAYLASAAIERLTRLRADAAISGFVPWNLRQKAPLGDPNLRASYNTLMKILDELVEALRESRMHRALDPSIARAVTVVEEAYGALKR